MNKIDMSGKNNPYLNAEKLPFSFRFKVYSEVYKELEWLIKDVEINFFKKTVKANVYEIVDAKTFDWIEQIIRESTKDNWTLTTLDAGGRKLYTQKLNNVKITDHAVHYDYSEGGKVVTHTLMFDFESYKKIDDKN